MSVQELPKLTFVGLGLDNESGITVEGLEAARQSAQVFAEFYTNLMPNMDRSNLEKMIGKPLTILERKDLEDDNGKRVIAALSPGSDGCLLVPGDPMIATTHITLRLTLAKKGIETKIVHSASIVSAVCGETGLHNYKFGRSVTLPAGDSRPPNSVIDTLLENRRLGLHTLLFLDVRADEKAQLTIPGALTRLRLALPRLTDWLAVGVARLGSNDQMVQASRVARLVKVRFGGPPQAIVFPGTLHFTEAEALGVFCGAEPSDLETGAKK